MTLTLPVLGTKGRAPKELAGYSPGTGSSSGSGGAGNGVGQMVLQFSAEGFGGPNDLGLLPTTTTPHEINVNVRRWYNFANWTTVLLEHHVDRATDITGTQMVCLWLNNGVWQFLGSDVNGVPGPTVPLDSAGDLRGTPVTLGADIIAAGDVLLGLFTSVGAANANAPGSAPGSTSGGVSGTGSTGTVGASKGIDVGFSINMTEAGSQSDYFNNYNEAAIIVIENGTETHLMPGATGPVTVPADITFDFTLLAYILTNAQAKGKKAKIYLFEGANGSSDGSGGVTGASPSWYNTTAGIITDTATATAVMYAIIDGIMQYCATNFPGVLVEVNVANEPMSGGSRNFNPWQNYIGDTWIRLAMVRVNSNLPGVRLQINNGHTEDDSNTALRNQITAFWTDILNNTSLTNLSNGNEMHITAADATSISGKLALDFNTIFGTGVNWVAWSLALWNMGVPTALTEPDVSDYTNDGPVPNNPATTIPLRDQAVADRMMVLLTAALTLPPGALHEVIFWQLLDKNTWLAAFLTPRQDLQAFRPDLTGTVNGVNYSRKVCTDGTNLFDRARALLTSLPNLGSGSAAGTGAGGTGGATGGGSTGGSTGGSGTGIVGSIEPAGNLEMLSTEQITEASAPNVPTTPTSTNGLSFGLGGSKPVTVTSIENGTGTYQLASSAASPQPSGLAFTLKAGQVNDPGVALEFPFPSGTGKNLYVRWRGMLQSGWGTTPINAESLKMWAPKDSEGNDHIIMGHGPENATLAVPGWGFGVGLQGPTTQNLPDWNSTGFPAVDEFQAGVWNTFEVAIYANSAAGVADGRVVLAINGVVGYDSGNTLKIFSWSGTPVWDHVDLYFARAVDIGADETSDQTYYMDQIYMSRGG